MYFVLVFIIFIFSVIIHECAHGYVADMLGDPTARNLGRLTLNPLKHIDPVGSIIVPIITSIFGFTFGWAKPVPYDPRNLKNKRTGELLIALAGPSSNILIALAFSLVLRFTAETTFIPSSFLTAASFIVLINLMLAIFNLLPIPPLDGSKILFSVLPQQYFRLRRYLETYGFIVLFIFVYLLWSLIAPIVPALFQILTGISLSQ